VASRVGGIPELVKDGENGFLFEAADAVQLSRHLERWLAFDSGERDQLRERARLSAEVRVDLQQVSQQYAELYRALRAGDFAVHQVAG
jgi:glycosyltransferase involved in cell wall biosynthesis